MANGHAFDFAMEEYRKRSGLRLAVHLDLFECRPLGATDIVGPLLDESGKFCMSFQRLWLRYVFGNEDRRRSLREAIRCEWEAQLSKVRKGIGADARLHVDSHMHAHMIPFVFDILLE